MAFWYGRTHSCSKNENHVFTVVLSSKHPFTDQYLESNSERLLIVKVVTSVRTAGWPNVSLMISAVFPDPAEAITARLCDGKLNVLRHRNFRFRGEYLHCTLGLVVRHMLEQFFVATKCLS